MAKGAPRAWFRKRLSYFKIIQRSHLVTGVAFPRSGAVPAQGLQC